MITPVRPKRKKKPPLSFVATCGAGLEQLVAGEIEAQGGRNSAVNPGAVSWEGNLESGYRMCLWSRFASRVLLQITGFDAPDADTLYRQAGKIDWDEHLACDTPFAVFSTVTDSPISHSKYAALRIKDAIADQFRSRSGRRPSVDTSRPGMRISLHLQGSRATLAVDLSGDSLHRRGYRRAAVEAPLKETLAAAIVYLSGLRRSFPPDRVVLDPMCGGGTLLIEAAMILGDSAPGLQRKSFGFLFWNRHDERLWEKLVNEAVRREEDGHRQPWPRIIGYDADPHAVTAARENIAAAGLDDKITVGQRQLAALERPADEGLLVVNPPYGERLADREEIKYLYRFLDRQLGRELAGWRIGFFSSNPDLAGGFSLNWSDSYKLFNGPIRCRLHCGTIARTTEHAPGLPSLHEPETGGEGADFAARLQANCRRLFPWAEREDISCFRLYGSDLPGYDLALDLYERWILATGHAAAAGGDPRAADHRFNVALRAVREILAIPPGRIFLRKAGGGKKKGKAGPKPSRTKIFEVDEQRCRFLVNLTDDRGTGLPLARRSLRLLIGRSAEGRTFLNLNGGTGTATVHALVNGALATTTVDPAAGQLHLARSNFFLNGFGGPQHRTIQEDSLKWLAGCRSRFGLILVNAPCCPDGRDSAAPSRFRLEHEQLLRAAMKVLTREGLLLLAVDDPCFTPAPSLAADFILEDISSRLTAPDFAGQPNRSPCFAFRHRPLEPEG
ncbi:MAG: bifunctional 23S rRNA (guanine(2069)-N(7))-methyltransferase RlmK/23S rRNA (guanine(2445)-N(2))-methyltransferase RlmL [Desulfobulbaceae bacterium]|nr:bifunctional 23S rRNA (guanine(2069)-N(7))-methyltransferase RlmK/23S rRNA (guanine(2445)-N(2))-methyltransferase RlmL [Desulfobulbaceae bacterium]